MIGYMITCYVSLTLIRNNHSVIVEQPVRGRIVDASGLRYEVDISNAVKNITFRDRSVNYERFLVFRDQCNY